MCFSETGHVIKKLAKQTFKMATLEDFFSGQPLDLLIAFLDTDPFDDEIEVETTEVNDFIMLFDV